MLFTLLVSQSRHNNTVFRNLLRLACFLTFLLLSHASSAQQEEAYNEHYRLVFWNVENLFDIWDDTTRQDDAFTPEGDNHWTARRYRKKLQHLCQTIAALGEYNNSSLQPPALIGLAEVENDKVLRDLCMGTPIRRLGYRYVHFDSPDQRGIDNALLYIEARFHPFMTQAINISDSSKGIFTRDILLVGGTTNDGDTLIVLVNHFPSKRGGATADRRRMATARKLRYVMDTIFNAHPTAAIVAMGDFNASPDEPEIKIGLMRNDQPDSARFVNLMAKVQSKRGSYKYQDQWSCIDQIIVSGNLVDKDSQCPLHTLHDKGQIFDADFLLVDDEKNMGSKVFRTYLGTKYIGGYSDHLPVFIDLEAKGHNR